MAITSAQALQTSTIASGTVVTVGITPVNKGNLLIVNGGLVGTSITATITDTGITPTTGPGKWTQIVIENGATNGFAGALWIATASSTAAGTISMTQGTSMNSPEVNVKEFTAGLGPGTIWAVQATNTEQQTSSATAVTYPSVTSKEAAALYFGYVITSNGWVAGSSAGFTYELSAENGVAWNPNCARTAAEAPTASQSPAGTVTGVAAIIAASVWTPPPPRSFTPMSRASTWFSRVPWHEKRNGLLLPQPGLTLAKAA